MLICSPACSDYGEAELEQFAAALGYTRRELPQTIPSTPSREQVEVSASSAPGALPVPPPVQASRARFYRVVAQRQLEPAEVVRNEPDWFRQAKPSSEEIRATPAVIPPPLAPLMRWARLWPFLKTALGAQQATPTLDIPRIVERLARGQTLRYLPRKQRQSWATAGQLVIDYAEPLLPFWTDFNRVHQRLRRLRGVRGFELVALLDGDPGGRCAVYTTPGMAGHRALPSPRTRRTGAGVERSGLY